jgi:hypothetical protein
MQTPSRESITVSPGRTLHVLMWTAIRWYKNLCDKGVLRSPTIFSFWARLPVLKSSAVWKNRGKDRFESSIEAQC